MPGFKTGCNVQPPQRRGRYRAFIYARVFICWGGMSKTLTNDKQRVWVLLIWITESTKIYYGGRQEIRDISLFMLLSTAVSPTRKPDQGLLLEQKSHSWSCSSIKCTQITFNSPKLVLYPNSQTEWDADLFNCGFMLDLKQRSRGQLRTAPEQTLRVFVKTKTMCAVAHASLHAFLCYKCLDLPYFYTVLTKNSSPLFWNPRPQLCRRLTDPKNLKDLLN